MGYGKRHICYMASGLLAAAVLLLLSSCDRNKSKDYDTFCDLCFEVACTPFTKADDNDALYCLWACDSATLEPELGNVPLIRQGQYWYPQDEYRWNTSKALDIYAAAPYSKARFDLESGVCFDSYSLDENTDLFYIEPILGRRPTYSLGVVSLEFKSALSLIRFLVQSNCSSGNQVVVRKLTVNGLALEGSFHSLPVAGWNLEGNPLPLLSYDDSFAVMPDRDILCEQRVIPQASELEVELLCDFTVNGVLVKDQPLTAVYMLNMHPGKLYELCLCIYDDFSLKIFKI
ncbi:MAG: hypothetical protein ACI4TM_10965 [Candidatus Cryptobacteroides sp.]